MDAGFEQRAEARRKRLRGGVTRSHEALAAHGVEAWQEAPGGARLEAMWQLLVDAWILEGRHGPPPRFQGSAWGVGRFER